MTVLKALVTAWVSLGVLGWAFAVSPGAFGWAPSSDRSESVLADRKPVPDAGTQKKNNPKKKKKDDEDSEEEFFSPPEQTV